jgi:Uma2 family endonuclease
VHSRYDEGPLVTIEEYEQLKDDGDRVELLRGRLIREPRPAYGHGALQARLSYLLTSYIEQHNLPLICGTDFGCRLRHAPDSLLAPDVAVTRREIASPGDPGFFPGAPELVVEIVSPSNRADELQAKVLEYLEAGARVVWIIYPKQQTVLIHTSASEVRLKSASEVLDAEPVLPGFRANVAQLFKW